MIVQCISFGSAWWLRPTYDERTGALIRERSAFMNTSGIPRGRTVKWGHKTAGFIRINAGIRPYFTSADDLLQGKFLTDGVEKYQGSNRLLLRNRAVADVIPERYLVRVRSPEEGVIDFNSRWRDGSTRIVSSSFYGMQQESLLLMSEHSTILTNLGTWRIMCKNKTSFLGMTDEK